MAGRPPKPVQLIKLEGKSHRTKAELETREKAENQLLTGVSLKAWPEVREDKVAKKEFNRLKKLLKIIEKDDALHEAVINRYCLLVAECKQLECDIKSVRINLSELAAEDQLDSQKVMLALDKQLMEKRKMLLQIERESVMTILSALRSIPKKPEEKQESPMAEYLRKKQQGKSG